MPSTTTPARPAEPEATCSTGSAQSEARWAPPTWTEPSSSPTRAACWPYRQPMRAASSVEARQVVRRSPLFRGPSASARSREDRVEKARERRVEPIFFQSVERLGSFAMGDDHARLAQDLEVVAQCVLGNRDVERPAGDRHVRGP